MNSNNYHFEIQVANATNGQKNGSVEESTPYTAFIRVAFSLAVSSPINRE